MIVVISQQIQVDNKNVRYAEIVKEFEKNLIPRKGDFITDTYFNDPFEV